MDGKPTMTDNQNSGKRDPFAFKNRLHVTETEEWLGNYYGRMIENAGGVRPLGIDKDIEDSLKLMAQFNVQNIVVQQAREKRST
jgi:hypothetical protein